VSPGGVGLGIAVVLGAAAAVAAPPMSPTRVPTTAPAAVLPPSPPLGVGPDKKERWLAEKAVRARRRRGHRGARRRPPPPVVVLRNLWTREVLPIVGGHVPRASVVDDFLRCHRTQTRHAMDRRLAPLLLRAARRFHAREVDIVSGFRAPSYNAELRATGHQVARESQHTHGKAVDFRIPGVPIARLVAYVKARRLGGVGVYPESRFVHADTGPVRTWRGR
jgi:hypothetical protein